MKYFTIILSLLLLSSCRQDVGDAIIVCEDPIPLTEIEWFELRGGIEVDFTTFKVNEDLYNPTDMLSDGTKVADAYDVPKVLGLPERYEELLGARLGDDMVVEIDGKLYYGYKFRDRMSNKPKYRGRIDRLINKDSPHSTKRGRVYILKKT